MLEDKNTVNAGFSAYSQQTKLLLDVKKAYQNGLQAAFKAMQEKRSLLAAKLISKKKLAHKSGYLSGLRKAETQTTQYLTKATELYEQSLVKANKDCLELAIKIAAEILQIETISNTDSLAGKIKIGIDKLLNVENLCIKVNQTHIEEMKVIFSNYPKKITITAEGSLEAGNAIIETENGQINLNWKTQLELIHQALLSKINTTYQEE